MPRRDRLTPQERTRLRREAAARAREVDPSDPFAAAPSAPASLRHPEAPTTWTQEDVDAHRGRPTPTPTPTTQEERLSRIIDLLAEIRDLLAKS